MIFYRHMVGNPFTHNNCLFTSNARFNCIINDNRSVRVEEGIVSGNSPNNLPQISIKVYKKLACLPMRETLRWKRGYKMRKDLWLFVYTTNALRGFPNCFKARIIPNKQAYSHVCCDGLHIFVERNIRRCLDLFRVLNLFMN